MAVTNPPLRKRIISNRSMLLLSRTLVYVCRERMRAYPQKAVNPIGNKLYQSRKFNRLLSAVSQLNLGLP